MGVRIHVLIALSPSTIHIVAQNAQLRSGECLSGQRGHVKPTDTNLDFFNRSLVSVTLPPLEFQKAMPVARWTVRELTTLVTQSEVSSLPRPTPRQMVDQCKFNTGPISVSTSFVGLVTAIVNRTHFILPFSVLQSILLKSMLG